MALDTDHDPRRAGLPPATDLAARSLARSAADRLAAGAAAAGRLPILRVISSSLVRRIFVSNLLGLGILVAGILYFSQHNAWLIDAKRESLKAQGEIIAAAIAANATVETERIVLDPDRLPEIEGARIPFRDDSFAALELSIRPERVAPILRRLVQPTSNRARIYGRDGTLIADSAQLISRGQISRSTLASESEKRPRTKNFWTRLREWLADSDLPIYREIGEAKGTAYPEVRMAMGGTTTPMLLINEQGEQIVSIAVPIQRLRAVQGVLLLSTQPGEIDNVVWNERLALIYISALAVLAAVAASIVLTRTVAGPMRRLAEAAERVSYNINARQTLPEFPGRIDEIGQMSTAFREMTAALYRRIEASEKFAADVAHELKNPLTAARSTAESLRYARTEEQRTQFVAQIQDELKRLNRLITDVANASRLDAELALQQVEPVDLAAVATGVVATFSDIYSEDTRTLRLAIDPALQGKRVVVSGHEGRLAQVVTNLVDNAVSFAPEGGMVTVGLRQAGPHVELSVEDDGPGIEPDKLETVFERFYTYRPTGASSRGKNSGLGLSISREIVLAHRGSIWAENRLPQSAGGRIAGARFVVRLPASGGASSSAARTGGGRARSR